MNYDHVIVFGDSLSDIGQKRGTALGWFGSEVGTEKGVPLILVNGGGRFSDGKNWADFMYEDASGQSLWGNGFAATNAASAKHFRLQPDLWIRPGGGSPFRYANYALGGAVGGHKVLLKSKIGLDTFGDEVEKFLADYRKLPRRPTNPERWRFLFFVMFGSNDVYTDEKDISHCARIVGLMNKSCIELASVLANSGFADTCRFVVAGIPKPSNAHRYKVYTEERIAKVRREEVARNAARGRGDPSAYMRAEKKLLEKRLKLEKEKQRQHGLLQFSTELNGRLQKMAGDLAVRCDGASFVDTDGALNELRRVAPARGIDPGAAQTRADHANNTQEDELGVSIPDGPSPLFCWDHAHPTHKGYEFLWEKIRGVIVAEGISFGKVNHTAGNGPALGLHIAQNDTMRSLLQDVYETYGKQTGAHSGSWLSQQIRAATTSKSDEAT
ncbi:MAG: SGNH/GDSL hydrolase family protein, partial [Verrucomicrobiota bacterium]